MRFITTSLSLSALLPLLALATPLTTFDLRGLDSSGQLAPLSIEGEPLDSNYIVVLKPEVGLAGLQAHLTGVEGVVALSASSNVDDNALVHPGTGERLEQGVIRHVYSPNKLGKGYYGYAGAFPRDVVDVIRSRPEVQYVEVDQIITVRTDLPNEQQASTDFHRSGERGVKSLTASSPDILTERGAPWSLARISHREPLHLSTFQRYDYAQASVDAGVDVYIIDTGVNVGHVELEGRARWGKTIPRGASDFDGNGHGSHCAGIAASRKYGVAKGANVIAVKVLGDNGSGTLSDVIAGITWAAEQAADKADLQLKGGKTGGGVPYKGSVGSMSLGGGKSQATDDAVNAAVESGMYMSVAAGNDNKDAADYSPARAKRAIAVGATTLGDERAYFSNHGDTVAIMAPGLNILSIWNGGNQSTNTISGTSMACPAVSGLIAYYLSAYGSPTLPLMSDKQLELLEDEQASIEDVVALYEPVAATTSSIWDNALSLLPRPIANFVAPTPKRPSARSISPAQMRGLIRKLATPGVLTDLPRGTPNLLAFNNATVTAKK